MAEYRVLAFGERPPVELWSEVFDVEPMFFTSLLDADETGDDISLAAFEGSEVVSSVHVFMRWIRDRQGRPLKVGGIGSVSTHPDHRGRGHSGRLLNMALDAMEQKKCVWSLLSTGVNDHYARHGWRTISTPRLTGNLRKGITGNATTLPLNDVTLASMAALYERSSEMRPMATVRSDQAWRTAIRYRLRPEEGTIFGAFDGERLVAYLIARDTWDEWGFSEAEGDKRHFPKLFATAGAFLIANGITKVTNRLPDHPATRTAFSSIVESQVTWEAHNLMVRPIAERIEWPDLFALLGDPHGEFCDLDAF